jgi:hypothetical protein
MPRKILGTGVVFALMCAAMYFFSKALGALKQETAMMFMIAFGGGTTGGALAASIYTQCIAQMLTSATTLTQITCRAGATMAGAVLGYGLACLVAIILIEISYNDEDIQIRWPMRVPRRYDKKVVDRGSSHV